MAHRQSTKQALLVAGTAVLFAAAFAVVHYGRGVWVPILQHIMGKRTVAQVLAETGESGRARMRPYFDKRGLAYPPKRVAFLAFKEERKLELYVADDGAWAFVRDYEIQAASGVPGPKLREGDRQVPEGMYAIEQLNPNSSYHLSMKLNYPNDFDRAMADKDGRTDLGGDIFIHGKAASIGCLAMGDEAIEELFTLVADVGPENVLTVIAPNDLRRKRPDPTINSPPWTTSLYQSIAADLKEFERRP